MSAMGWKADIRPDAKSIKAAAASAQIPKFETRALINYLRLLAIVRLCFGLVALVNLGGVGTSEHEADQPGWKVKLGPKCRRGGAVRPISALGSRWLRSCYFEPPGARIAGDVVSR